MVGGMTAAKFPWFLTKTLMVTWPRTGATHLRIPGVVVCIAMITKSGSRSRRTVESAGARAAARARRRRQGESREDNCGEQVSESHHDPATFMRRELNGRLAIVVIFCSARLL